VACHARGLVIVQTIGNTRGIDINSPLSAKTHAQDLQLRRHQQRDDSNNAQGLNNSVASDRDCDSMTTTRLRHRRLRRTDDAAPKKAKFSSSKSWLLFYLLPHPTLGGSAMKNHLVYHWLQKIVKALVAGAPCWILDNFVYSRRSSTNGWQDTNLGRQANEKAYK
jgi:hypothetical protein